MNRLIRYTPALVVGLALAIAVPAAAVDFFPGDTRMSAETRAETNQRVDLDDDDVLLAIALDNTGFNVDFDDVIDVRAERVVETDLEQDVDLDRDDALLAIALDSVGGLGGHSYGLGGFGGLGNGIALADIDLETEDRTEIDRRVDIDEDDALLGIALAAGVGGGHGSFASLADIHESVEREVEVDSRVDLDSDTVLLGIALEGSTGGLSFGHAFS